VVVVGGRFNVVDVVVPDGIVDVVVDDVDVEDVVVVPPDDPEFDPEATLFVTVCEASVATSFPAAS
jgi:hypothetical protein